MNKNLMVTVSGGRSSAFMARHIQTNPKYKDFEKIYVFANTGQERPETIKFLKNIVECWGIPLNIIEAVGSEKMGVGITYKVVDFDNISMNSEPFDEIIKHKNKGDFSGLPHSDAPYCSENLKTIPCKKFCDNIFGVNNYIKAIGFRKEDMPKRISWAEIKEDKKRIFPLLTDFEQSISNRELNDFYDINQFKLTIHNKYGNCELCWKKSEKNIIENIILGARTIDWWQKKEIEYNNTSFRNNKSINDYIKMSKLPQNLKLDFDDNSDGCVCNF